jgi:hypothetical protein
MSIKAMKLALEALEQYASHRMGSDLGRKAITALRTAIAEAESVEPRCAVIVEVFGKDWRLDYMSLPVGKHKLYTQNYVYTTLPAAQQEPDAYGYAKRLAVAIWEQHYKDVAPQWKPFDDLMGVLTQIDNMTAGLTAQNQRQPLTDERVWELAANCLDSVAGRLQFARAIEAAHGIGEKK